MTATTSTNWIAIVTFRLPREPDEHGERRLCRLSLRAQARDLVMNHAGPLCRLVRPCPMPQPDCQTRPGHLVAGDVEHLL